MKRVFALNVFAAAILSAASLPSNAGQAPQAIAYVPNAVREGDGTRNLQPLAAFMTNPAGSAIVDAIGPIRQVVQADAAAQGARRYLVIAPQQDGKPGTPVQAQSL